ncbi:MAG TPA: hypothetical protein VLF94_06465 [Chlamydiales bacterium]|nr:hypothetical protein [Chlamydiales bacterium]
MFLVATIAVLAATTAPVQVEEQNLEVAVTEEEEGVVLYTDEDVEEVALLDEECETPVFEEN